MEKASTEAPVSAAGKRVILCDRDETILLIMKHLLQKLGFVVSVTLSPQTAIAWVHDTHAELLIWELNPQPEIDFHMLQDIQQEDRRPYVILLSTPNTLHDDSPIVALGSGDVFIKPFEPAHLVRRIKWLIKLGKV